MYFTSNLADKIYKIPDENSANCLEAAPIILKVSSQRMKELKYFRLNCRLIAATIFS